MKINLDPYFLGIDIGTGSVKVVGYGLNARVLFSKSKPYSSQSLEPGYFEQDAGFVWTSLLAALEEVSDYFHLAPLSIGFSCAMHSLMVVNPKGSQLSPVMTWADSRSEAIADKIRNSPEGREIYALTGTPIHSMSPLCKVLWLKENRPDLYASPNLFISLKSYIWFKLFSVFEEDWSIASASGLMDIHCRKWADSILHLIEITPEQLPVLVPTTWSRRNIQSKEFLNLGFNAETALTIGASDGCCAALGSGAHHEGGGSITIGTSGAVRVATSRPIQDYSSMIFNYILDEETWISGGATNNGGIVLDWGIQNFIPGELPQNRYSVFFKEISTVSPGSNGLIFLPYLSGERSPIWDEKSSGTFIGLNLAHTRAHLLRAILEGICFSIFHILTQLESEYGFIDEISVSGGFTDSLEWIQILSDITGKKLNLFPAIDASALGAGILGLRANKKIGDFNEELFLVEKTEFSPEQLNHELYLPVFERYRNLYPLLKPTMNFLFQYRKEGSEFY